MIKKQIKKNKIFSLYKKKINIPLIWIIVFSLLLAGISFVAGIVLVKAKLKLVGSDTTKLTSNTVFDAENTDKPELDFYVMSFCPYGNQIETTLQPVFDLIGDNVTIRPRYIFEKVEGDLASYCKKMYTSPYNVSQCPDLLKQYPDQIKDLADCKSQLATIASQYATEEKTCNNENQYLKVGNNYYTSLHGRIEANQNVREICAYNLTEDKKNWWDFIKNVNDNCTSTNADTCWEEQAKKAGLDTNKITECFNNDASKLIEEEIADTTAKNISGSPTIIINGKNFPPTDTASTETNIKIGKEVFSLNDIRNSNVIKAALCTGFKKEPKVCSTEIKEPTADTVTTDSTGNCN